MSNIISADNGAFTGIAGIKLSSDTSGALAFQTGNNVTALTVDSSQNLSLVGGLTVSGSVTHSAGTTNGVAYLNGSKVLTTGSALTFDGSSLGVGVATPSNATLDVLGDANTVGLAVRGRSSDNLSGIVFRSNNAASEYAYFQSGPTYLAAGVNGSERMRIDTSGNVGIGTSSPAASTRLTLSDTNSTKLKLTGATNQNGMLFDVASTANSYYIASGNNLAVLGDAGFIIGNATGVFAPKFYVNDGTGETRTAATTFQTFWANGSERMRIDSSGNLGLGVTPSAFTAGKTVEVGQAGNAMWGTSASDFSMVANVKYNGALQYANGGVGANRFNAANGAYYWYNAPSGTAGNAITFTQAMTLDASGNLGIGTTSPSYKLDVTGAMRSSLTGYWNTSYTSSLAGLFYCDNTVGGGSVLVIRRGADIGSGSVDAVGIDCLNTAQSGVVPLALRSTTMNLLVSGANYFSVSTNGSERARIDSSGNLIVGGTSPFGLITSLKNSAGGYSSAFTAKAIGGANSQLTGYSFMPTFGNTTDYTPRRAADIWSGFNAGNWGSEFLAFGVGVNASNDGGSLTTERMRITGDGAVLVGSTSAIAGYTQVSVTGSSTNRGAFVMGRTTAATTGVAGTLVAYNGSNIICGMDFQSNSANNSGYIGTYTHSAGSFVQGPYLNTAGTSWTTASDQNLKDVTGEITNALTKVSQIRAVEFTWKADESKKQHVGFIAQEVQTVLPEVIDTDTNGYLGVRYAEVTSLLVAAIKEQQALITQLQADVAALKGTK